MEYGLTDFFVSDSSLLARLCRLMTGFDESVAVFPYTSGKTFSRYEMWLVPAGESRTVKEYVGGSRLIEEKMRLYLRHGVTGVEDITTAESILREYITKLCEAFDPCDTIIIRKGDVRSLATDGTVWDFYAEFEVLLCDSVHFDGISFYITFGDASPRKIGFGCTSFREENDIEIYSRRYFDSKFSSESVMGEKLSYYFEFEDGDIKSSLYPVFEGDFSAVIYVVRPDGSAKSTEVILSELSLTDKTVKGRFTQTGEAVLGQFDVEEGVFYPDSARKESGK